jgi:hypothetical protein
MRRKALSPILADMDDATLTVTLELRIDGDVISGRATGDNGEGIDFEGWLGLLGALDALVLTTSEPSSGRES